MENSPKITFLSLFVTFLKWFWFIFATAFTIAGIVFFYDYFKKFPERIKARIAKAETMTEPKK